MLDKFARLLVDYCVEVKEGELVHIDAGIEAAPLVKELVREILQRKARPIYTLGLDETGEYVYRYLEPEDIIKLYQPNDISWAYINTPSKKIDIGSSYNTRAFSSVNPEKLAAFSQVMKPISDRFMERISSGDLKWVFTHYPNHADAQEAGMPSSEYRDFVFRAMKLHEKDPIKAWKKLRRTIRRYKKELDRVHTIEIESPTASMRMSVRGRKWIVDGGEMNMPGGEIFTSPVEDSVEGWVKFTYPLVYFNNVVSGVEFRFKGGKIVEFDAEEGKELLEKILSIDEGARRLGEVAFGLNYDIDRFIKNALFDEKIGGTMHMAIGKAFAEANGKNDSAIHIDLVFDMKEGRVKADGKVIYEDGKFVI